MSDRDIEAKIQAAGKTAPRVTPADIEANIASEHYLTAADGAQGAFAKDNKDFAGIPVPNALCLLTFCVLVLKNGFTVTGESACASPENFDPQIGRDIARQNAVAKIWPLMGYELRTQLAMNPSVAPEPTPTPDQVAESEALPPIDPVVLAEPAASWKPRIGNQVMVKGYIANGTDEHAGLVTRVHGAGEGAFANVTAFPDLQSPKIFSSIPVYTSRAAADADIPGATRRRDGFAYLLPQE